MVGAPGADLVAIDGAGHTPFGEKPEESLAALRGFLDGPVALADRTGRWTGLGALASGGRPRTRAERWTDPRPGRIMGAVPTALRSPRASAT